MQELKTICDQMYLVNQDVSECVFSSKPGRLRNLVFVCETSLKTENFPLHLTCVLFPAAVSPHSLSQATLAPTVLPYHS